MIEKAIFIVNFARQKIFFDEETKKLSKNVEIIEVGKAKMLRWVAINRALQLVRRKSNKRIKKYSNWVKINLKNRKIRYKIFKKSQIFKKIR